MTNTSRYLKLRLTLKSELRVLSWYKALKCLNFAENQHTDFRKDGVTPEYQHQIEIALFAMCLVKFLRFPEETICVILLHDTPEDKDTEWSVLRALLVGNLPDLFGEHADDVRFANRVLFSLEKITKVYKTVKKNITLYIAEMVGDPISSIAKCLDRMHNLSTMVGVFTIAKLKEQVAETEDYILVLLKDAQNEHPEQFEAYEIVKNSIKTSLSFIKAYINAAEAAGWEK